MVDFCILRKYLINLTFLVSLREINIICEQYYSLEEINIICEKYLSWRMIL